MNNKASKFIVLMIVFLFVLSNTSNAVLIVFEMKKKDVLFVGDKKVEGGKKRSIELEPGVYKIRLVTSNKKPVHLPDDDMPYYPDEGKVVIKKEVEIDRDMIGEIIDLTTSPVEE